MPSSLIAARESPGGPPPGSGRLSGFRWAVNNPPNDPQVSFSGRTVLVTGANTGLGLEAAIKFSALGADKLLLGVRSVAKGEAAKKHILSITGRETETIDIVTVDLSDFASVQAFISQVGEKTQHLDVALLGAGLCNPNYETSKHGWEMAVQVNVLSTALMAVLLLPLLRSTAAAGRQVHMTFLNSVANDDVERQWINPSGSLLKTANDRESWSTTKSYSMVKLLGLSVMQGIAHVTSLDNAQPKIIVNAVCPSLCKTDLGRNFSMAIKLVMIPVQAIFARTAEQGARCLVSAAALAPESHGLFWSMDILYPMGELAKDQDLMKQTWCEIFEVIQEVQPNLQQILDGSG